jgi:MFS transporter, DHA1 family, inner membrane transport protein
MWGTGIFAVYTYIAEIFEPLGASEQVIGIVIFLIGVGSSIGVGAGGYAVDRIGSTRTIILALSLLMVTVVAISLLLTISRSYVTLILGMVMAILYGVSSYGFNPAQQHRIIELSGVASGIVISLQASCIYLGSSFGAIIGGVVMKYASINEIGFVAGGLILIALLLTLSVNQQFKNNASSLDSLK